MFAGLAKAEQAEPTEVRGLAAGVSDQNRRSEFSSSATAETKAPDLAF